jgi:hypothetical protein
VSVEGAAILRALRARARCRRERRGSVRSIHAFEGATRAGGPRDARLRANAATKTRRVNPIGTRKRTALAHGVAFWNTFEAMGGEGSMAAWVRARPELGARTSPIRRPWGPRFSAT